MAQKIVQHSLNVSFIPAISPLDAYADGDAFGAAIDITSQLHILRGAPTNTFGEKFFEVASVFVADYDNQQAAYDIIFKGEDFTVDIVDNDPFDPAPSDRPKLLGPVKIFDTIYTGYPVGAAVEANGTGVVGVRVPLIGTKLLVKVVIRKASTFNSASSVTFRICGHVN
jgi:hypothetical protein